MIFPSLFCSESKKGLSPRIAERERRLNASESGREAAEREEDGRSESAHIGEGVKRRRTEGLHINVYFLEKVMRAVSFSPD